MISQTEVEAALTECRRKLNLTGAGLAVLHGSQRFIACEGVRVRGTTDDITTDDAWHIGSVGKSITATLVAHLMGEELESKLPALLPDFEMHPEWSDCRMIDLLNHTSGLPANFPLAALKSADQTPRQVREHWLHRVLGKPPKSKPGERFRYSNTGYTLAGHILERRHNQAFEELMSGHLFEPLNLTTAGFGPPQTLSGHRVLFGWRRSRPEQDNPPILSPAGRVHMSLGDLLSYGALHLAALQGATPAYLPVEHWNALHEAAKKDYASGWVIHQAPWAGGRLFWHNGSNRLWYTLLVLLPERDAVAAFTTNDGAYIRSEGVAFRAIRSLMA